MKYANISFPGIGLEINPDRVLQLGPLNIHFYGLAITIGLILAVIYGMKRSRQFGLNDDLILDGVLWITPFAIICARAYYCIFSWQSYAADPIKVLYIWEGGLAIYGGVLGAIIGMIVFCKVRKIRLLAATDLVALGFLIGQSIGRWGNFFNREAFGSATDSFFRMGLYNTRTAAWEYHHPTFLYESVWNAVGFVLLHKLSKKRKYDGQVSLGYVAWYGLGRAMIEGLRTDSLYLGATNIRVSQLLAAASCAIAVILLVYMSMKQHDPDKLFVNQVNARLAAEADAKAAEETEEDMGNAEDAQVQKGESDDE